MANANVIGYTGVAMDPNVISERDSYQSGGAAYQAELAARDQQAQALATMRAGMPGLPAPSPAATQSYQYDSGPAAPAPSTAPKPSTSNFGGIQNTHTPGRFVSPTTGNWVTWDTAGNHTDTGQKASGQGGSGQGGSGQGGSGQGGSGQGSQPGLAANPYQLPAPSADTVSPAPAGSPGQTGLINWAVNPNQTVQQQAAGIAGKDSVLMQQARSAAMQQMNTRGLVNSSMAIGAGEAAVLDRAIDIGKQDANTFASSGQYNTGQTNAWNSAKLDRAQQTSERLGVQGFNSSENAANRQARTDEYRFDAQTRTDLATIERDHRGQISNDAMVDNAYTNTVSQIAAVDADTSLDAPAKATKKNTIIRNFKNYARIRGINMDLSFDEFVVGNTSAGGGNGSTGTAGQGNTGGNAGGGGSSGDGDGL